MLYAGIDPGKYGGVAVIMSDRTIDYAIEMPEEIIEVFNILTWVNKTSFCVIEKAQAMTRQGVTSTFNYGVGYGELLGALKLAFVSHRQVRPQEWNKHFGLGRNKSDSIKMAREFFPDAVLETPRGRKLDGVAEALLMAEYARFLTEGNL